MMDDQALSAVKVGEEGQRLLAAQASSEGLIMDDEFEIGYVDQRGDYVYINKRGIGDVSEFIRNSEAYGRRIFKVRNVTWEKE